MNNDYSQLKINQFFTQDKFDLAIEYLEPILLANPDNYIIKSDLALAYLCLKNYDYAQDIYLDLILKIDSESLKKITQNILNLADVKFKEQKFSLASSLYQQVLEFDDECIVAYLNLADCFILQGFDRYGISLLEKLITIEPNLVIAYEKLGYILQVVKEDDRAIVTYQKYLEIDNKETNILEKLADCYLETNQIDLAKDILEKIIILSPNNYNVYGELAYIYLQKKDLNSSIEYLKKLLNSIPNISESYLEFYTEKIANNQTISSEVLLIINLCQAIVKNDNNYEEIALLIAQLFFKQKKQQV